MRMPLLIEIPGSPAPTGDRCATRPWPWRRLIKLGVAAVLLIGGVEAGRVLVGSNFHTVLPGHVYRGAQPSPEKLEALVKEYGIKTIVNLRGCCNPMPWYLDQCRLVQRLQISQEDICLSAARLPSAPEIRRLIEVLDRAEYPLYLHCWRGADRTGLAAALVLLLKTDATLAAARGQLDLRYGHLSFGKTGWLDEFFHLYAAWLEANGLEHSPAVLRRWAREEYQGGWYAYRLESTRRTSGPPRLGKPLVYTIRARNSGTKTWNLRPHSVGGIHAAYRLCDADHQELATGRAGLFAATVAPGESIDLTVVVPPIHHPGRYRLMIDLVDRYHAWFFQTGSEPLDEELDIK